jgi:hypothetical protein
MERKQISNGTMKRKIRNSQLIKNIQNKRGREKENLLDS